ncbi:large subunit of alpha-aminoadipate reductase [Podochytrium sp. JEL0797]|nr:large subunit of alpha-aminoadipate reductase [Podochytrium sp. JEL0797]
MDLTSRNVSRLLAQSDLVLPTDYPRPIPAQFVESSSTRSICQETSLGLLRLAISNSASFAPFEVLLAAFVVLLHKHSGEEDVSVGSSSLDSNVVVLRCPIKNTDSFAEVLENVAKATQEAHEMEIPFQQLLDAMFPSVASPTNDTALPETEQQQNPSLFKVRFFNLTDTTPDTLHSSTTSSSSSCDLTILISQSPSLRRILPIDITVLYNSVLFSSARVSDMLDQLEQVIQTASAEPSLAIGKLSLVTKDSKLRLPDPTLSLKWDQFEGAIPDLFAANAALFPERCCVVESVLDADGLNSTERSFTYKQIHEASNIVAHALIAGGIQREDVVVLYSYRGVDLVIAVMGVLKSGATFSVIDPAYPPPRQIVYLQVAQPRGLVVLKKAGVLDDAVRAYVQNELEIKIEIPALEILEDGALVGGAVASGGDVLDAVQEKKSVNTGVVLGPDSIGTLSFTRFVLFIAALGERFLIHYKIAVEAPVFPKVSAAVTSPSHTFTPG